MKKILITGASGCSGGFLVKEALNRGYETWAGVRSTSSRVNLQDERIRCIDLKYSDRESLTAQLADFVREHGPWDYVIHNAGLTKTLDKRNFYLINAQNTANLIEALAASGCKPEKFLLMSSLSSYGVETRKHSALSLWMILNCPIQIMERASWKRRIICVTSLISRM